MIAFILRRLVAIVPILWGISLIIFVLMSIVPGDPIAGLIDPRQGSFDPKAAEELRRQWGLDRPKHEQYLLFLGNAIRGDLGRSLHQHSPVLSLVADRLPATARLAAAAMLYATVIGVGMGILAAVKRNTWLDTTSMIVALAGVSMPVFWLGLMLMLLFGVILHVLPVSGMGQGELKYLVLPAVTLGSVVTGIIARVTRSAMLEVLGQDYIRTARAKGLSERMLMYRHALKNALIPVVTIIGVQMGGLLAGAVITETVFNWPGVGRLLVQSIFQRDLPVVQGVVLSLAVMFAAVNLVVDLIYGFVGTLGIASAILAEASLSFLGLGVQPPTPSWGSMLAQGRDFIHQAWWMTAFPGAAIFLTILGLNLLGDGLRDALDPRLRA